GNEQLRSVFSALHRNSQNMLEVLSKIIELGEYCSPRESSFRPLSLVGLVGIHIKEVRRSPQARDISLDFNFNESDYVVNGDFQRLSRVFDHLLHNAFKHVLPGGKIEVQLSKVCEGGAEWAVLSVADDG